VPSFPMGGRPSRKIGGRETKKRSCCRETSLREPSMIRTCSQSAGVTMSFESASTRSKPGPHKTRSSNADTWLGRSRRCPAFRRGCLPRFRAFCHRLGCRYLLRPVQWRRLGRRNPIVVSAAFQVLFAATEALFAADYHVVLTGVRPAGCRDDPTLSLPALPAC